MTYMDSSKVYALLCHIFRTNKDNYGNGFINFLSVRNYYFLRQVQKDEFTSLILVRSSSITGTRRGGLGCLLKSREFGNTYCYRKYVWNCRIKSNKWISQRCIAFIRNNIYCWKLNKFSLSKELDKSIV